MNPNTSLSRCCTYHATFMTTVAPLCNLPTMLGDSALRRANLCVPQVTKGVQELRAQSARVSF